MYLEISPQAKIKYAWKHKFRAAMMLLTKNSNINFNIHFNKDQKKYHPGICFALNLMFVVDYMCQVISSIHHITKERVERPISQPQRVIVFHQLERRTPTKMQSSTVILQNLSNEKKALLS